MPFLGGLLIASMTIFPNQFGRIQTGVFYSIAIVLITMGLALGMFGYLRLTSSIRTPTITFSDRQVKLQLQAIEELHKVVSSLKAQTQIAERASSVWTDAEREKVVATLSESVTGTLSDAFLKSVEERYGAAITSRTEQSELRAICDESKRRIHTEIDALTQRSSMNLIIGNLTTLVAVGLLVYIALTDKLLETDIDITSVLLHFIPRLSIAIFIEIFSFFFLRLYKSGLADIKYYQNELTNIEARHVALEAVMGPSLPDHAQPIITEFAKIDRNNATQSAAPKDAKPSVNIKDLEGLIGKINDLAGKVTS